MPGRRHSILFGETGHTLASGVLRALGQGLVLAALGLGGAAMFGSPSVGIESVLMAGVIGFSSLAASATLPNNARRQQQAEDGQAPECIGVIPLTLAMGAALEKDALVIAEGQSDYVARLARERGQRETSSGRLV
jgi:Zn-dependent protease